MKEFILENLVNNSSVNLVTIILNNVVSMIAAFFIMFVYKLTHTGTNYSKKFNLSLGAIALTTTMIMGVISNNVALSLGMVGALSIIRFRTAVKDVRDAAFIFWAVAVGIGCGVSQYALIGIGSICLLVFMLLTKQSAHGGQLLLIIQSEIKAQNLIEAVIEEYFGGKAHQIAKNASISNCEIIYRVGEIALEKAKDKQKIDIIHKLMKIEGVVRVNKVEQQDEISR